MSLTDQFPTATFELTEPIDLAAPGVTKSVTIPIEAARDGDLVEQGAQQ